MRTLTPGTRQRIFDAAARLFSVQRFHEVRMEDLAVEADVGKGTVYRYFRDKEDLYRDLIATAADEILEIMERPPCPGTTAEAQLITVLAGLMDFFVSHPYFFDLFQHVETFNSNGEDQRWVEVRKKMFGRLETLLADETLAVDDPPAACLMLLGAVRTTCRFGERPLPPDMALRIVSSFLHGAARRQCCGGGSEEISGSESNGGGKTKADSETNCGGESNGSV